MIEGPPTLDDIESTWRGCVFAQRYERALAIAEHMITALRSNSYQYLSYDYYQHEKCADRWHGIWLATLAFHTAIEGRKQRAKEKRERTKREKQWRNAT